MRLWMRSIDRLARSNLNGLLLRDLRLRVPEEYLQRSLKIPRSPLSLRQRTQRGLAQLIRSLRVEDWGLRLPTARTKRSSLWRHCRWTMPIMVILMRSSLIESHKLRKLKGRKARRDRKPLLMTWKHSCSKKSVRLLIHRTGGSCDRSLLSHRRHHRKLQSLKRFLFKLSVMIRTLSTSLAQPLSIRMTWLVF